MYKSVQVCTNLFIISWSIIFTSAIKILKTFCIILNNLARYYLMNRSEWSNLYRKIHLNETIYYVIKSTFMYTSTHQQNSVTYLTLKIQNKTQINGPAHLLTSTFSHHPMFYNIIGWHRISLIMCKILISPQPQCSPAICIESASANNNPPFSYIY